MGLFSNILNKLKKAYITSSEDRYVKYLKRSGVKVGQGVRVLDPKRIEIDVTRPELLEIGNNVFLHRGMKILTHDWASFCFVRSHGEFLPSHRRVKIGNNVWFGENVSVLAGAQIGDNVIIGFGSVVTKNIPSNSIAVGCPAKVICDYETYLSKRLTLYVDEAVDYACAIYASGNIPRLEDFWDDYPCFVDEENYKEYSFPYRRIFKTDEQFNKWLICHKKQFNGFDDFLKFAKDRYENSIRS